MATLIDLDGFNYQAISGAQASSGFQGTHTTVTGTPTVDTSTIRAASSKGSLKCVGDGATAQNVTRNITDGRVLVGSFYIKYAAAPNVTTSVFRHNNASGDILFQITTDGKLNAIVSGGTTRPTAASLADGLWHLVDYRAISSASPATIDWAVDTSAQTQATNAQTAADMTSLQYGIVTATSTMTVFISDVCVSATSGDYPLGAHHINPLFPTGEGTETLGTTNTIINESASGTNLYLSVDDWATGAADTTTYVTYSSTVLGDAASNFAEFTMSDVAAADTVFWGLYGMLAGFANGTGADTAACQVLTAHAGTRLAWLGNVAGNTGLIDYSGSATVLGYNFSSAESSATLPAVIAPPGGGWTASAVNALVVQWGFSNDTNAIPRLSAVLLEYASPGDGVATAATTFVGFIPI